MPDSIHKRKQVPEAFPSDRLVSKEMSGYFGTGWKEVPTVCKIDTLNSFKSLEKIHLVSD